MGAKFHVQIVNATPYAMNLQSSEDYQMDEWSPLSTIAGNSYGQFNAEYKSGSLFTYNIDDSAKAEYTLEGYGDFKIKVKAKISGIENLPSPRPPIECGYGIKVEWENIPHGIFVYPPPDTEGKSPVGWLQDGCVSIGIGYTPGISQAEISPYPKPQFDTISFGGNVYLTGDASALEPSVKHWAMNWMELYEPCIGNLCLQELTLPGTHDAGTYNASGFYSSWDMTQVLSIQDQLSQGVRCLDIRLRIDGTGDTRFQFCHDDDLVNLTFLEGAEQIVSFLMGVSREVVLLNFHRMTGEWSEGDVEDLALLITDTFDKDTLIPESMRNNSLSEILETSGRLVIGLGKYTSGMPSAGKQWLEDNTASTNFWSNYAVDQYWCGSSVTTWNSVAEYMDGVLEDTTSPKTKLWALMAQYNTLTNLGIPANVPKELSRYFSGENGLKSNVIHSDWWSGIGEYVSPFSDQSMIEKVIDAEALTPNYSALINAVPLNMLKGYRRSQGESLF